MQSTKLEVIRQTPIFAVLEPREIELLVERAVEKKFAAGQYLFYEGDPCEGIYILGRGKVKIFKTSPSGREILLAMEEAPSSVAEVPLFDGGPYPASVTAIDDVVAYLIRSQDFRSVCRQNPEVAIKLLAVVGQRLRQLVGVVESVTFGSIRQRLAATLLEFGKQAGSDSFALPVTHQELASRLGTVREVVSRNLSRFQMEGLLRIQKREITLLDPEALRREVESEW